MDLCSNFLEHVGGYLAQMVGHWPSKQKVLSSIPGTPPPQKFLEHAFLLHRSRQFTKGVEEKKRKGKKKSFLKAFKYSKNLKYITSLNVISQCQKKRPKLTLSPTQPVYIISLGITKKWVKSPEHF